MPLLPSDSCSIKTRDPENPQTQAHSHAVLDKHVEHIKANNLRYMIMYVDDDDQVAIAGGAHINDMVEMSHALHNGIGETLGHLTGKKEENANMRIFSALTYVAVNHLCKLSEATVVECMERWLNGMKIVKAQLSRK